LSPFQVLPVIFCGGQNKNNPAFARKSYEDEQLIARLESGKPMDQKQIDEALQPVWV
jgi:hypothetical protein